jgi:formylglycine-generating enzyme required for sulfatase activity
MLDMGTFIVVAVAAVFVMVGVLAWMVDAGLSDKAKVRARYCLFAMLAAVLGLFFLIEDDSEFEYSDWERSEKAGGGQRGGPAAGGGGGSGGAAGGGGGGGGGPPEVQPSFANEEEESAEEQAAGDGTIQDCLKCPVIVPIKAGQALIGSTSTVALKGGKLGPARNVAFSRDFGIGKYEITVEEFQVFVNDAEYKPGRSCRVAGKPKKKGYFLRPGFRQHRMSPVVCVNWKDANHYTDWLSRKTGVVYRLPTEIEWEYAARAGVTGAYLAEEPLNSELANFVDKDRRGSRRTLPVGRFAANGNGMHDVHGNVWELTSDCWSNGYLSNSDSAKGEKADCSRRVAKGGGWFSSVEHLNLAIRVGVKSEFANNGLGFRVVREGSQQRAENSGPVKATSAKARGHASTRRAAGPPIRLAGKAK